MSDTLNYKFNKRTHFTVYAWIRNVNKNKIHIPNVIKNIIIRYFRRCDQFLHNIFGNCSINLNGMQVQNSSLGPQGNCQVIGDIKIKKMILCNGNFKLMSLPKNLSCLEGT